IPQGGAQLGLEEAVGVGGLEVAAALEDFGLVLEIGEPELLRELRAADGDGRRRLVEGRVGGGAPLEVVADAALAPGARGLIERRPAIVAERKSIEHRCTPLSPP